MTYADLIFSPFCDALVSSLASRSHQWVHWEMLQHFEAHGGERLQIAKRFVELRIQLVQNPQALHLRSDWRQSPSLLIAEALSSKLPLNSNEPFTASLGKLRNDEIEIRAPQSLIMRLHDLDEELPAESQFGAEDLAIQVFQAPNPPKKYIDLRYRNSSGKSFHSTQS